jgi:uncharacterized protein YbjT (DUF2867 family)
MSTTLVIGATGTVGSAVLHELVQRGVPVRAVSSRAAAASSAGVEWVRADVVSGAGIADAFNGVSRAFVLVPPGHANQHELVIPLVEQAKRSGLEKVVLMTAFGANANPQAPLRLAELALEASGLNYNILRPNWFMQNFNQAWLPGILASGKVHLPVGDAKASFIDTRDIGAVAARLLAEPGFDREAIDLTGPAALSVAEAVAELSKAAGVSIGYEAITPEAMRAALLGAGLPAAYADFLVLIMGFLAAGYNAPVTDGVRRVLGRDPIAFARYAQDHRAAWAPLAGKA